METVTDVNAKLFVINIAFTVCEMFKQNSFSLTFLPSDVESRMRLLLLAASWLASAPPLGDNAVLDVAGTVDVVTEDGESFGDVVEEGEGIRFSGVFWAY